MASPNIEAAREAVAAKIQERGRDPARFTLLEEYFDDRETPMACSFRYRGGCVADWQGARGRG